MNYTIVNENVLLLLIFSFLFIFRIIKSNNQNYEVGQKVFCSTGWRTHSIINPNNLKEEALPKFYVLPDFGNLSPSLGLGVLGMPG